MKKLILFAFTLLALATQTQAQTVTVPVENAPYLGSNYTNGSGIVLTATNDGSSTTFAWSNSPIGAVNYTSIGREYIGAADTIGACPGSSFNGIPNSLQWKDPITNVALINPYYTAWNVPVHFNNKTCAVVNSMKILWNDYQLATNNSAGSCIDFESYAAGGGALVTDGLSHRYYLELFSLANMKRVKVVFDYTLPVLPHACPGQTIPEAPASVTSPSAPAKSTGKPPKKN